MGGLVGWNSNSTVSNSYATGLVTGGSFAGALFGTSPTTVSHTFYDKTVNPTLTGIAGTADTAATVWGMSTTNMKSAANFTSATAANGSVNPGWDFTAFSGIWASSAAANTGYPCLLGVACSNAFVRLTPGSSNYGDVPNLSYGIYTSSSGGALITDANPSGTAIWSSPLSNTSAVNSYSESYVSGVSLGNALYMFNVGSAATWNITQRPISLKANDQSRAYGSSNPSTGAVSLTAGTLANTDALGTASLTSTATSTTAASQTAALTPSSQIFTLGNASNYAITYVDGTLSITQRPISVKAKDQSRAYGDANPGTGAVTLTAGTLANTDSLGTASLTSPATNTTAAGQTAALTPSNQSFTLGNASNYAITYVDGTLTITQRPISVKATDQSRAYGNANPSSGAVTLTAGTLASSDSLGTATLSSPASSTTAAGQSAALTPSSQSFTLGNTSNYAITYIDGALTITQRPISVKTNDLGRAYGDTNPGTGSVTLTAGTLANTDALGTASLASPATNSTAAGQSAALTPSNQSFTLGSASNYAITYVDGALTITQRPISVKANDQSRVYGNANPSTGAVTLTAGTLANSDTLGTATVTSPATATTAAGQTLALTPSNQNFTLGAANNYTITYVDGTLAITPAPFATQAATVSQLPVLPPQLAIDANLPLAAAERVTSNPVAIPVHVNMEPVSVGNGQASDQIAVYVMRPASVDQSGAMAVALPKALFGTANGFSFALPSQLMDAAHQATAIRVSLVGGEPLPEWMAFHAESKRFVVSALPGDAFPLHIMVQIGDLAATIDIFEAMQWAPLERL